MSEHDDLHDHDKGLSHDLPRFLARRRLLSVLGGVGATVAVAACGSDGGTSPTATSGEAMGGPHSPSNATVADGEIPEETAGPFPGDGSNGPTCLARAASCAATSPAASATPRASAEGVPLTIRLKVYDLNGEDVTPLAGAAVYLWHCDREGELLDVLRGRRRTRTTCAACRRPTTTGSARVHQHLPGGVRRPLAAHPLRGLPERSTTPRRPPTSCAPRSSRCRRTSARTVYATGRATSQRREPRRSVSLDTRHGLRRRLLAADGHGRPGRWTRATCHAQRPGLTHSFAGVVDGWAHGRVPSALPDGDPAPARRVAPGVRAAHGLGQRPFGFYVHVPFCTVRCGYCDFNTYTAERARRTRPAPRGRRTPRPRSPRSGWPAGCSATRDLPVDDGLLRRRYADAAAAGRPRPGASRRSRDGVRARRRRRGDHRGQPGQRRRRRPGRAARGRLQPDLVRHAVGGRRTCCAVLDRTHDPLRVPAVVGWARDGRLRAGQPRPDLRHAGGVARRLGGPRSTPRWRCEPDHVSAYSLIVEDGTALARQVRRGELPMPDDDDLADKYLLADERVRARPASAGTRCPTGRATDAAGCRHNLRLLDRRRLVGRRARARTPTSAACGGGTSSTPRRTPSGSPPGSASPGRRGAAASGAAGRGYAGPVDGLDDAVAARRWPRLVAEAAAAVASRARRRAARLPPSVVRDLVA